MTASTVLRHLKSYIIVFSQRKARVNPAACGRHLRRSERPRRRSEVEASWTLRPVPPVARDWRPGTMDRRAWGRRVIAGARTRLRARHSELVVVLWRHSGPVLSKQENIMSIIIGFYFNIKTGDVKCLWLKVFFIILSLRHNDVVCDDWSAECFLRSYKNTSTTSREGR